ncbi:MAG: tetratricopeptide repeat protein [Terriglobales bacterium]
MNRYFILPLFLALAVVFSAPLAHSQTGTVKGVCKNVDGTPIAGAEVEWDNTDTGQKYTLKTDKKGQYFSLGILPGKYNVKLSKDGKEIFHYTGVPVSSGDNTQDIDLKKEQAVIAAASGKTPEQLKAEEEQREKAAKENNTVKALNEKLNEANAATTAGDFEKAIATLNEAIAIDNTRDLIWFKLADAYRMSAPKQTDPEEKKKRYEMAIADYQKAIDIRKGSEQAAKDPENNKKLAAYYNNLAEVYSKEGKVDGSIVAYNQAAQLAPDNAAQFYFNEGAVLTNAGKPDEANAAFDKVIAADPNKALAYYWKGINLIGKATVGKDNKMVAPYGTAQAFQKYLELDPSGPMAQTAKDMLASIGAPVETGFGTKKKPSKK